MNLPSAMPGVWERVGPGPLTTADRLVLFSLKSSYLTGFRVSGTWFLDLLQTADDTPIHKMAAESFWDAYSQTAPTPPEGGLRRALQKDFGWYLDIKMTERLKESNRRLSHWQKSEDVWRRAAESDRIMNEKWRAREAQGNLARDAYLAEWEADDAAQDADHLEREKGTDDLEVAEAKRKAESAKRKADEARARLQGSSGEH